MKQNVSSNIQKMRRIVIAFFSFAVMFACVQTCYGQIDNYATGMKLYKEANYKEAMPYMLKAANEGTKEAQYQLCIMYKRGQGIKTPNATEAYNWCKKSAEQGYGLAEYELAESLQTGWGVTKDPATALDYYFKASKQGVPEAQYALGLLYEFGDGGVKQSYYQARTLYMWASGKGYSPATYRVGTMYEEGKGIRPSMAAALRWYRKAAAMGNEDALAKLNALKQQEEEMENALRAAEDQLAGNASKTEK